MQLSQLEGPGRGRFVAFLTNETSALREMSGDSRSTPLKQRKKTEFSKTVKLICDTRKIMLFSFTYSYGKPPWVLGVQERVKIQIDSEISSFFIL